MKTIIILNQELGICQAFNCDGETLTRVWEFLSNKHNQSPIRVPPSVAKLIASSPIEDPGKPADQPVTEPPKSRGRLITLRFKGQCKKCGNPIARGENAYHVKKGHVEHEVCPPTAEREKPKPKKVKAETQPQTDAEVFAKDLAAMMKLR